MEFDFIERGLFYKHAITDTPTKEWYYMHTHNIYELLYLIDGDVSQVIEDKRYKLVPGDLVLMRPFKYHYINIDSPTRYERYNLLIDPKLSGITNIDLFPADTDIIHISEGSIADEIIRRADYYAKHYSDERLCDVLCTLFKELFYSIPTVEAAKSEFSVISPILSRALEYVNERIYEIRDFSEICSALFISESYLYRLFAKELKKSPSAYVREKRLLAAERMIADGAKPTEIYSKVGFLDYTVFYRNYKSFFGISPIETRNRKRAVN